MGSMGCPHHLQPVTSSPALLPSGPGWAGSLPWVPPPLRLVLLAEDPPCMALAAVAVRLVSVPLRAEPRVGLWVFPCSSEEQLPLGMGSMQWVGGMQAPLGALAARGLKLLLLPSPVSLLRLHPACKSPPACRVGFEALRRRPAHQGCVLLCSCLPLPALCSSQLVCSGASFPRKLPETVCALLLPKIISVLVLSRPC